MTGNVVRAAGYRHRRVGRRGAGTALIADNVIAGATRGAIVGMDLAKAVTGDLRQGRAATRSSDQRQPGALNDPGLALGFLPVLASARQSAGGVECQSVQAW